MEFDNIRIQLKSNWNQLCLLLESNTALIQGNPSITVKGDEIKSLQSILNSHRLLIGLVCIAKSSELAKINPVDISTLAKCDFLNT